MTKKILYIMHVDWRLIKQRPHFIAEGLSDYYELTVVHFIGKKFLFRHFKGFTTNEKNINIVPVPRLPLYQEKGIYDLNKAYLKFYFQFLIKKYDPEFIWITFPQLYEYIPPNTGCKIIYDCMDDATGFDFKDSFKLKILKSEERLVEDASIVFTSSNHLFNKLMARYQCKNKLKLIRNAFSGKIIEDSTDHKNQKSYKIGYIGTISKWIDFPLIERSLEEIKDIEYHFIGPCELENTDLINERITFHDPVPYNDLYDHIKNFDCLVAPFKVDEKIKSADPGKLYGYINYNKPIISVYYDELNYFSNFIYFYFKRDEFIDLLKDMIKKGFNRKYSNLQRMEFLKENSWDVRMNGILNCIKKL